MEKVNVAEKLGLFTDHWSPKVVGQINNVAVKLVKFQGEFVWHHHELEDEMFYVISGIEANLLLESTSKRKPRKSQA